MRVRIGDYAGLQRDLISALQHLDSRAWSVNSDHWRQDGTYHSGGGFTSMLPLVLARREGPTLVKQIHQILGNQPAPATASLDEHTQGWGITVDAARIDIYDLGMAVLNIMFEVRTPSDMSLQDAARSLKRLLWLKPDPQSGTDPPIASAIRELAHETARQFSAAADTGAASAVQQAWLSPFLEALPADSQTPQGQPDDWGRLLWLHPVHLVDIRHTHHPMDAAAAQLAPPFHRTIDIPDGRFVPGIGWSAIVTSNGLEGAEVPLHLIELHWAYIALYMEIDRGLLALLDNDRWYKPESLAALEHDADRVFGDYIRVMEARARLDSALASLGGDEYAIWEVIADVTKFDALLDGVDRKVEALQRVAERRVQQAAATRARRTSSILSSLTALTVVTVAVALIDYFLGGRSDPLGHIGLRVALAAAALAASIGLYLEAYRERTRRRRNTL